MQLRARILALVFLALAWPAIVSVAQAQAPDPDRLAAAKEMMDASRVDRQFEQVIPLLLNHLKDGFRRAGSRSAWHHRQCLRADAVEVHQPPRRAAR